MRRYARVLLIGFLLCSLTTFGYGQTDTFTSQPQEFIDEIEDYLTESKQQKLEKLAEQLVLHWTEQQTFTKAQKAQIIQRCNLMRKKNMRPSPHFYYYFRSIMNIVDQKRLKRFEPWHKAGLKVIKNSKRGRTRPYKRFLRNSVWLFKNQTLYTSKSKTWRASSPNYVIVHQVKDSFPYLRFPEMDLTGITKEDTITIYNTKGRFDPVDNHWYGKAGKVTWERAGFSKDSVYGQLPDYHINTTETKFSVDSVEFYYKTFFEQKLLGHYEDQLIPDYDPQHVNVPRFHSYQKELRINDIAQNTDYVGGFLLKANRIIGTGGEKTDARLYVYDNTDTLFVFARSNRFLIKQSEKLSSKNTETTVYLGEDSIYHPGLHMEVDIDSNLLYLRRGEHGRAKTAFHDSYHKLNFECKELMWRLGTPKIELRMRQEAGETPVLYESWNYFEKDMFQKFQGMTSYNPISEVKMYAEEHDTRKYYADELAKFINPNLREENIQTMLFTLVEEGFIYYEPETGLVTVRPKTYNYVYANAGFIDYDHIRFLGMVKDKTHGNLNLDNYEMTAYGIPQVRLSKAHDIVIVPKNQTVIFNQNRNMSFSGGQVMTQAGAMNIFGRPYDFNYSKFSLKLKKIDSFVMHLPDTTQVDAYGNPKLYPLNSTIEDMKAILRIDTPTNKSGRKHYPRYPILESLEPSYVYYDLKEVHNKVYDRDSFYFELDKFQLDSLDNFDKSDVKFTGTFKSQIFPDIRETLKVQRDTSLGFKTQTPEEGLPAYGGRGQFYDKLHLSNAGLQGSGTLDYLPSTSKIDSATFFPDSMNAITDSFVLPKTTHKGTRYPSVEGQNIHTHWEPDNDKMVMNTKGEPFDMYEKQSTLEGEVVLTPSGISGKGGISVSGAEMSAGKYTFQQESFSSDSLDLKIKSSKPGVYAFKADNVRADVNMKKREGTFVSNADEVLNKFPVNEYVTSMDKFDWDMDQQTLTFENTRPEKPYFLSINHEQDSLRFRGERGKYDLSSNLLTVRGVEYIPVADAHIYPDTQKVQIEEKARMRELKNAKIKADTTDFHHNFYEANVNVNGRFDYKGEGKYKYVNKSGDPQEIYFYKIETEQDTNDIYRTHGTGIIEETDSFFVNPQFAFKGKAHLFAPRQPLRFDGHIQLRYKNPRLSSQWFSVDTPINPKSMTLTIEEPENPNKAPLFCGFHMTRRDHQLYPTFFGTKQSRLDHDVFNTGGILKHDLTSNHFRLGNKKKLTGDTLGGTKYVFKPISDIIYTEGKYDLGFDFDSLVRLRSAGQMEHRLQENSFRFNLVLAIDFYLEEETMKMFRKELKDVTYSRPSVTYDRPEFNKAMTEFVGEKKVNKMQNQIRKEGTFELPEQFKKTTLLFTDVEMAWDSLTHSYRSVGPVGLGYINGKSINKKLKGYIEFKKKRSVEIFNLYLQGSSESSWYYFTYRNTNMNIFSTNQDFINQIMDLPNRKRRVENNQDERFNYSGATSVRRAQQFKQSMINFQKRVDQ